MYLPEFWIGFAVGVAISFACIFVVGAFIAFVNARNTRVELERGT